MPSQTEIDTAKAQAKTQADTNNAKAEQAKAAEQTQQDTAKAEAQTRADTASSKSKQNGGDGGTGDRMTRRENASGLRAGGNNTMSGRYMPMPTMAAREAASGVAQTMEWQDPFYFFQHHNSGVGNPIDHGLYDVPAANGFDNIEEDNSRPDRPTTGFSIVRAPGDKKVCVLSGYVILTNNGDYATAPQTGEPGTGTEFSYSSNLELFLNVTASATSISCNVSTSAGNHPIPIGTVSSDGVITQALTTGDIFVEICGNCYILKGL